MVENGGHYVCGFIGLVKSLLSNKALDMLTGLPARVLRPVKDDEEKKDE